MQETAFGPCMDQISVLLLYWYYFDKKYKLATIQSILDIKHYQTSLIGGNDPILLQ